MERTQERGLSSGQAWGVDNGVHHDHAARDHATQDLALVDAGISAGVFGYDNTDARLRARLEALDEARLEDALAEHALAHEQALLSQSRKSKLALLRGEADGSVRGLRNAVISIGHWFDLDHAPEDSATAPTVAGYAESWRIGWAERLPEIMQLSIDGPLEEMGLEDKEHMPSSELVPEPFRIDESTPAVSAEAPSEAGRAFLAGMLAEEDESEGFVFAGPADTTGPAGQGGDAYHAQEQVMFAESQYAALHGALFDGDAAWEWKLDHTAPGEAATPHEGYDRHGPDAHGHSYDLHFA